MPKINPDALKSIVFIGSYNQKTCHVDTRGTGFIIRFREGPPGDTGEEVHALVTARHTLDEIRSRGGLEACVRFNLQDGGSVWKKTLIEDWDLSASDNVDVALYICRIPPDARHLSIGPELIPGLAKSKHFDVQVTDDVAILGLFAPHYGRQSMIPIARLGTVAALSDPDETISAETSFGRPIHGIEAHLLEIRSIGGVSGSPVFAFKSAPPSWDQSTFDPPTSMFLFGMISGHFPYTEKIEIKDSNSEFRETELEIAFERRLNAGIAYATPIEKLVSVLKGIDPTSRRTRLFFPLSADLSEGSLFYQMRNLKAFEITELVARMNRDSEALKEASTVSLRLKELMNRILNGTPLEELSSEISELRTLVTNDSVRAAVKFIKRSGFKSDNGP